jgi:glycosyltransferase involved in cell wall biosynthesis
VTASPPISVVISAFTEARWDDLLRAVASVRAQTAPPLEVIVVIDGNDRLLERARRRFAGVPGVVVVENDVEPGLSGARNAGVVASRGDVIAFIDDDAVAEPEWLERLSAHYRNSLVLGVGGAIIPRWLTGRPRSFPSEFDWVVGCTYRGLPETTQPVRNLIGANMSLRRTVFEAVGGFRSDIGRIGTRPLGCEETELCLRATSRWPTGLIVYEPLARVLHTVTPARGTWRYFLGRCYGEGLSKAVVARLAGSQDGLRAERKYVLHTLPRGLLANLAAGTIGRDLMCLPRLVRITIGVFAATAGYYIGTARLHLRVSHISPGAPEIEPRRHVERHSA